MTQHQEAVDWKRILSEVPYPIEAFAFVREGLSYAVQRVHEDPSLAYRVCRNLSQHVRDLSERVAALEAELGH